MLKKVKQTVIKKIVLQLNSELNQASNNLKYYENLYVELQEEINNIKCKFLRKLKKVTKISFT